MRKFKNAFKVALQAVYRLNQEQKVFMASHLSDEPDKVIDHGLYNLGDVPF